MLKPNLYVVGMSKTGKTSLAKHLSDVLKPISASEWVKKIYVPGPSVFGPFATTQLGDQAYLNGITNFSCKELQRNPDVCMDFIRRSYPIEEGGFVIEGLRNPRDFAILFRPNVDKVAFLHYVGSSYPRSDFETEGTISIRLFVHWLRQNKILAEGSLLEIRLNSLAGPLGPCHKKLNIPGSPDTIPCWNLDEAFDLVTGWMNLSPVEVEEPVLVQKSIPPFPAHVDIGVLYNSNTMEGTVPCSVFGISSYTEHALTFQVMLPQGAMFSYVPVHKLRWKITDQPQYGLQELVYARCPDDHITVTCYEALKGKPCQVYLKRADTWIGATYITTIDWYRQNDLAHLLALENGQYALQPSHKVLFGVGPEARQLPDYKKLRAEWRVDGVRFEESTG